MRAWAWAWAWATACKMYTLYMYIYVSVVYAHLSIFSNNIKILINAVDSISTICFNISFFFIIILDEYKMNFSTFDL